MGEAIEASSEMIGTDILLYLRITKTEEARYEITARTQPRELVGNDESTPAEVCPKQKHQIIDNAVCQDVSNRGVLWDVSSDATEKQAICRRKESGGGVKRGV